MSASPVTSIPERRNWIRALGWIAALAVAAVIIVRLFLQIDRPTEFHSYFTASRLVMEGQSVDQFYDNAWFREQSNRLVPGLHEIFKPNVPTTAVAYGPFAFFQNYVEARLVWTVLSLLLLVWFIEELIRIAGADSVARPFWYAAVLLAQPIQLNLFQGQAYIVVAAGLILALKFWQRTRDISAGATLAALFAYKSAGTILWPVAIAAGRWRIVLTGVAVLILIVIATWPIIGASGWLAYLKDLRDISAAPGMRSSAYQSVESIVRHLLSEQGRLGSPVVALPVGVARGIAMAIALLLLGFTMYAAHRHPDNELVVGAALLLALILIPLNQIHAYPVALIPTAQLARRLSGIPHEWKGLALWAGSAMIVLPTPNRLLQPIDGWAALLAYPKLYGGLLLWAACMSLIMHGEQSSARQSGRDEFQQARL